MHLKGGMNMNGFNSHPETRVLNGAQLPIWHLQGNSKRAHQGTLHEA